MSAVKNLKINPNCNEILLHMHELKKIYPEMDFIAHKCNTILTDEEIADIYSFASGVESDFYIVFDEVYKPHLIASHLPFVPNPEYNKYLSLKETGDYNKFKYFLQHFYMFVKPNYLPNMSMERLEKYRVFGRYPTIYELVDNLYKDKKEFTIDLKTLLGPIDFYGHDPFIETMVEFTSKNKDKKFSIQSHDIFLIDDLCKVKELKENPNLNFGYIVTNRENFDTAMILLEDEKPNINFINLNNKLLNEKNVSIIKNHGIDRIIGYNNSINVNEAKSYEYYKKRSKKQDKSLEKAHKLIKSMVIDYVPN